MSNRIPHSLSWLIQKRSELLGELQFAEKNLPKYIKEEEIRIKKLKASLKALDGTIRLHHIKLDPKIIEPTRPKNKARYLPHGGYTTLIFDLLRAAYPEPVSSDYLAEKLVEASGFQNTYKRARLTVRNRMKELCRDGYVKSAYENSQLRKSQKGLWTLNPDRVQNPKKLVNGELPTTFLALPVSEPPA